MLQRVLNSIREGVDEVWHGEGLTSIAESIKSARQIEDR
jgi:hypothetical protein